MPAAEPIAASVSADVAPEDQARAAFYALLARLWYAGPDAALLHTLARADPIVSEGEQTLAARWRELQAAAAVTDPAAAAEEYDALFVGTGKAPITLYMSHYLVDTARERVLVALREQLSSLGLARAVGAHEPEDHLAALCEVMRHLICSCGSTHAALREQRKFFATYIARAYNGLLEQVCISTRGDFYKNAARFSRAFLDVETTALEML